MENQYGKKWWNLIRRKFGDDVDDIQKGMYEWGKYLDSPEFQKIMDRVEKNDPHIKW
jgi:hypothetical protein